jgi:hypothetical protein
VFVGDEPGSFARGEEFQVNEATGDSRISGSAASLVGIEQAIEAAEKARTKGRIGDWVLLSPAGNTISRPMAEITLDGGFFFSRDADAYSLALCRAIHEALRDRP